MTQKKHQEEIDMISIFKFKLCFPLSKQTVVERQFRSSDALNTTLALDLRVVLSVFLIPAFRFDFLKPKR